MNDQQKATDRRAALHLRTQTVEFDGQESDSCRPFRAFGSLLP
jgi:hypothetical protein